MASKGQKQDKTGNKKPAPKVVDMAAKARQDEMSRKRLAVEAARAKSSVVIQTINERIEARARTAEKAEKISERIYLRESGFWDKYSEMTS